MGKWQRLSSKTVYQNQYFSLWADQAITPDGRSTEYSWIEIPPAVFIIAINDDNKICLVQQERYVSGEDSWEVPGGGVEGEDELDAAKRELAEEAGIHADHWERTKGERYPYNFMSVERDIVFIAKGLHKVRQPIQATDDVITGVKWVSWTEVKALIKSGEISDGQSVTALTVAGLQLGEIT